MRELKGHHDWTEREKAYGTALNELAEKIVELQEKITKDQEENKDINTGVAFAVFRRQNVASLIRDNSKLWTNIQSVNNGFPLTLYATIADVESEIIWTNLFKQSKLGKFKRWLFLFLILWVSFFLMTPTNMINILESVKFDNESGDNEVEKKAR